MDNELALLVNQAVFEIDQAKEEARRKAKEQEELRKWCKEYIETAQEILQQKGITHEYRPKREKDILPTYSYDTKPMPLDINSENVALVLKGWNYNPNIFNYRSIDRVSIEVCNPQEPDNLYTRRRLFNISTSDVKSWSGEATPEQRFFAMKLLQAFDEALTTKDRAYIPDTGLSSAS